LPINFSIVARHAKPEKCKKPQKPDFNVNNPTKQRKYGGFYMQQSDVFFT
jgi:hypothetical protein